MKLLFFFCTESHARVIIYQRLAGIWEHTDLLIYGVKAVFVNKNFTNEKRIRRFYFWKYTFYFEMLCDFHRNQKCIEIERGYDMNKTNWTAAATAGEQQSHGITVRKIIKFLIWENNK